MIKKLKINFRQGKYLKLKVTGDHKTIEKIKENLQVVADDYQYVIDLLNCNSNCERCFNRWKKFYKCWQQIMMATCPHAEHAITPTGHEFCLKCKNITRKNVVEPDE